MLDLNRRRPDLRAYVAALEAWLIATLDAFTDLVLDSRPLLRSAHPDADPVLPALAPHRERVERRTYHGPGQRVAYVMLDLNRRRPDLRAYVAALEAWLGLPGRGAGGVERRMLDQPDALEGAALGDRRRPREWVVRDALLDYREAEAAMEARAAAIAEGRALERVG
jgi:hypothetical protein